MNKAVPPRNSTERNAATAPIRFAHPRGGRNERRDRREKPEPDFQIVQWGFSLAGGLLLFLIALMIFSVGYRGVYNGRIFPGISVAGVDLSGLKPVEAAVKLQTSLSFPSSGRIVLRDGANVWVETPSRLGMSLDSAAAAQAAFDYGRTGGLWASFSGELTALQRGTDLPPVVIFDQRLAYVYLQTLAAQIDQPVTEASLQLQGVEVAALPGKIGRSLNVDATLGALSQQMQLFRDGEIPLAVDEQAPEVLDASSQAELARRLLSAPLVLYIPDAHTGDPGPWEITPEELAPMLRIGRVLDNSGNAQHVLTLDPESLTPLLETIASQTDRTESNARFIFNDQTAQLELIEPATIGLKVDLPGTLEALNLAIAAGQQSVPLSILATQPKVASDATAAQLGISQLVSMQTTFFYGSSAARLQNIQTAAANFHGVLVAPGETFSMGQYLGDVSLDNGYAEALIIYGGKTIKGVGGGVCQVSTTLFRTAFFGGFPINERYAHAYRVSYYEQRADGSVDNRLAGMDATVYFPLVDFKFTNDTPYWLLMENYFDGPGRSLTWKFYSTSDGRTVTYDTSGPINIAPPPPPVIQENLALAEGEIKQVDWATEGADVSINRVVMVDGKIHFADQFQTHYEPWGAVCEFGPGIEDPEKVFKKKGLCQGT
jgi:vancomycin resistance protein YoaR